MTAALSIFFKWQKMWNKGGIISILFPSAPPPPPPPPPPPSATGLHRRGTRSANVHIPSSVGLLVQSDSFWPKFVKCRPWQPINFRNSTHGGHKRQLIRPRTNNFLSLVWNITKLPHRIELAIPKNPIVFRFCYILAGK